MGRGNPALFLLMENLTVSEWLSGAFEFLHMMHLDTPLVAVIIITLAILVWRRLTGGGGE